VCPLYVLCYAVHYNNENYILLLLIHLLALQYEHEVNVN